MMGLLVPGDVVNEDAENFYNFKGGAKEVTGRILGLNLLVARSSNLQVECSLLCLFLWCESFTYVNLTFIERNQHCLSCHNSVYICGAAVLLRVLGVHPMHIPQYGISFKVDNDLHSSGYIIVFNHRRFEQAVFVDSRFYLEASIEMI
ncbi:hypothetical protein AVEN_210048-1 [Araneus ventricosus]|uniref:Uncharacterized protein n=1 Tax=Araneus ventricosus TaxID=182803 RepID=A0A4Y2NQS8_ARAVE|nr:hypothetical protein AVEN_210048-1 [Araneus ventricosus]